MAHFNIVSLFIVRACTSIFVVHSRVFGNCICCDAVTRTETMFRDRVGETRKSFRCISGRHISRPEIHLKLLRASQTVEGHLFVCRKGK